MQKDQECLKFETQLVAHLEGEDLPEVREHASRCAACQALLDDFTQIVAACRQLPLEDPSPQVWLRIRASLLEGGVFRKAPSRWQRWLRGLGVAAEPAPVAALAGLAMLSVAVLMTTRLQSPPVISSDERLVATTTQRELGPDVSDEGALGKTITEMESSYRTGKSKLDPSLRAVYEKSLASLNISIAQCRSSVQDEPSSELAHEYLLNAYAQKAEVLTSALEYEGR